MDPGQSRRRPQVRAEIAERDERASQGEKEAAARAEEARAQIAALQEGVRAKRPATVAQSARASARRMLPEKAAAPNPWPIPWWQP